MAPLTLADDSSTREGPPDVPRSLEEISDLTNIVPDTLEFELLPPEAKALIVDRPGAAAAVLDGRVAAIYGVPLAEGASAGEAEAAFWSHNGAAFGFPNPDLMSVRSQNLNGGRFTVFSYQQRITGLPVEYSRARLIVRNGETSQVVMVSGRFVEPPLGGLAPVLITPEEAVRTVLSQREFGSMEVGMVPQLVVFAGNESAWSDRSALVPLAVPAWKFFATDESAGRAVTFFVNAESGELLEARNDVHNFDVTGMVQGWATPWGPNACFPDSATNPPQLFPIPGIKVSIDGGGYAFSGPTGQFQIAHGGIDPVTVRATVIDGQWANVVNLNGVPNCPDLPPEENTLQAGQPSNPFDLILNVHTPPVPQWGTAQLNALIHTFEARKFFVDRSGWTGLNTELTIRVNSSEVCNAFYEGASLRFARQAVNSTDPYYCPIGYCIQANYAFSSVIRHEMGHFIVNQLGLTQSSFGEGFGDTCAVIMLDDPVVSRNTSFPRSYEPGQPEKTYPCPAGGLTELYDCGAVLAGFWRDILERCRANIGTNPGQFPNDAAALEYVRQLFVDWSFITVGGAGRHAGHPLIAQEVLIVSDDDGVLGNGTPHSMEICNAALSHALVNSKFLIQYPGPSNPYCTKAPSGTNEIISFHPPQATYSSEGGLIGVDPFGIAVGDLNPPTPPTVGLKDVVLVCEGSSSIPGSCQIQVYTAVASSDSSYVFSSPAVIPLPNGSNAAKVALADMAIPNRPADGKPDIVVTLPELNAVRIFINQGNGTFSTAPTEWLELQTVTRPIGIAVANWDQTNGNDIAVAGYAVSGGDHPAIGFLWSQGGGSYDPASIVLAQPGKGYDLHAWNQGDQVNPVHRLAITNEILDLTPEPNTLKHYVTVFFHTGGQTFNSSQALKTKFPSRAVTTGIVTTTDAFPDIVYTTWGPGTNRVGWIPQLATGLFEEPTADPLYWVAANGLNPLGIAAGPLGKRDSSPPLQAEVKIDLIEATPVPDTSSTVYSRLQFFRNSGIVDPDWRTLFNLDPDRYYIPVDFDVNKSAFSRQVVVIDMNGDGLPDVLTANRGQVGDDDAEGFSILINRAFGD